MSGTTSGVPAWNWAIWPTVNIVNLHDWLEDSLLHQIVLNILATI